MFVRWESQTVEAAHDPRLPGFSEDVVVRRFNAPEALDTRFHEVRTKSAINRVPPISRVPFEYTVNPYRGCSHACCYCQRGDTRILMADGSHRALGDLREGDAVYGTVRDGTYRRLVRTVVLAHWSTMKRAYRVTLADGTELVASGDHRYLTRRGWKHVTGTEQGHTRRPHLTVGSELLGVGRFAPQPDLDAEYRDGYLCGMVRGDAHLNSFAYTGRTGRTSILHRFRLALADGEALERTRGLLEGLGVRTTERVFSEATAARREMNAIATASYRRVERIREAIQWPREPSDSWRKGFLAGIFDAEGSCSAGPAITRKQDLEGHAIKTDADLRVISIEPLPGLEELYDITTGTGDFIADGVVSHNCFARPTHEYLDLDAGRDFEKEIIVKVNVPEVLRAELARPSWGGHHIAMGTNTDPYQWVEGRYKLMRGIWEAMRDFANPCSILTKSPLLLRDKDLLLEVAERTQVSACLSVPTLEEKAWRATEPHTPHPRARLEAVAELNRIGIPTGILIAPLMPGINDQPEQVRRIVALATEAGAVHIGGQTLFLRGSVRDIFFEWLREHRPDLLERYERLYASGAYLPADERRTIERAAGAPWARSRRAERFRHRGGSAARRATNPGEVRPQPQQSLF
jgi:DNA repair photolyase